MAGFPVRIIDSESEKSSGIGKASQGPRHHQLRANRSALPLQQYELRHQTNRCVPSGFAQRGERGRGCTQPGERRSNAGKAAKHQRGEGGAAALRSEPGGGHKMVGTGLPPLPAPLSAAPTPHRFSAVSYPALPPGSSAPPLPPSAHGRAAGADPARRGHSPKSSGLRLRVRAARVRPGPSSTRCVWPTCGESGGELGPAPPRAPCPAPRPCLDALEARQGAGGRRRRRRRSGGRGGGAAAGVAGAEVDEEQQPQHVEDVEVSEDHEHEEVGPRAHGPRAASRRAGQRRALRPRRCRRRRRHRAPARQAPRVTTATARRSTSSRRGAWPARVWRERGTCGAWGAPHLPPQGRAGTRPKLKSHNLLQINQGRASGNRLPGGFRRPCPYPVPAKRSEEEIDSQPSCGAWVYTAALLQHCPTISTRAGQRKGTPRTSASFKNKVLFFTCLKSLKFRVQGYSTETSCCPWPYAGTEQQSCSLCYQ